MFRNEPLLAAKPARGAILWIALGIGLAGAGAAWLAFAAYQGALAYNRFQAEVAQIESAIRDRFSHYEKELLSVTTLIPTDGHVPRARFAAYWNQLTLERYAPGLWEIGYAPWITDAHREAHVAAKRSDGFPDYRLHPEGARAAYLPVANLQPLSAQILAEHGLDLLADRQLRALLIAARDTGRPVATTWLPFASLQPMNRHGILSIYFPVFRPGRDTNGIEPRAEGLAGFVFGLARAQDVFRDIPGVASGLSLAIFEGAPDGPGLRMPADRLAHARFSATRSISFGQTEWLLQIHSTPAFEAETGLALWLRAGTAGATGMVLFGLVLALGSARKRELAVVEAAAEQAVARENVLRKVVNSVPNGLILVDRAGNIDRVNKQAEAMFGYSEDELHGRPIEILLPERFRANHPGYRAAFMRDPRTRAMGSGRDLAGLRKDGSEFPVEVGLSAMETGAGTRILCSVIDVTGRKRLEERFRLVVEAAPNAVIASNAEGIIELVNSQTEAWFGYSRDELIGQPIEMLVPARYRGHHPRFRAEFMTHPRARPMGAGRELYGLRKDGREFPVEIGLTPIRTEEGLLILSSVIDISERKEIEHRFRTQAEQIAAASRYKSEFLANMSHELRTPLNSILLLSEQLRRNRGGNLTPKQVQHATIIHRSGNDLLTLINDILDLSKIEAGRMPIQIGEVLIEKVAESIRSSFAPVAENRGLDLTVVVTSDAPRMLQTDGNRLHQILRNLLSNALKFTEQGTIRVRFYRPDRSELPAGVDLDPSRAVAISVTDTGPGIPEDKRELIFEAFQQADGSTARVYGGTGLGLTICRQLASILGGVVRVSSTVGVGSSFVLYLPERASQAHLEEEPRPALRPAPPIPSVPATGDDRSVLLLAAAGRPREELERQLLGEGYEIVPMTRTDELAAAVAGRPRSRVIIDADSLDQLADAAGALGPPAAPPARVVIRTACREAVEISLFKELGAVCLDRNRSAADVAAALRAASGPGESAPRWPGRRVLLVDDDIRNTYALCSLFEDLDVEVMTAGTGQEALDVVEGSSEIDLVLMDMAMPEMDGYEATRRLKSGPHRQVPVVAVTAYALKGDREKCLAAGADDYLAKPIKAADVVALMERWFKGGTEGNTHGNESRRRVGV